ncbi:hypothetical protein A2164_03065 [Candidatus Curtissbacteria bacterium RBG_13_35_7]|uniref:Type II secretion system protein GspF domain-containing protein n=1 Tax=Candidatus Curtissbacteria bacterium RBG_13_35_7 TaxID=1797705 RepID=A0A1F5G1F6_9BACT|nr:MAG: hypothetical protein A2164_03065 [Candidatus Curtissbacteria bacterium RBG_13_35_7]
MKSLSLSSQDRLNIIDTLATFLTSGIPILEAVESLSEESKGNTQQILKILMDDLNQGKTIAYSFARHPKAFDPITVNLIKAAEEAGTLETTLKDLTKSIQKDIDFLGSVKGSLLYPVLVLIVLFAVIILNLFFVIPRISKVFSRLKVQIPLPTKILIVTSNFVNNNLIFLIVGLIIFIVLIIVIFKTKKTIITNFIYSLPVISKLVIEIDIARFTHSMSLLLKSGIPINEALKLSRDVTNKKEMQTLIIKAEEVVISGKTLSSAFKRFRQLIPGFVIRITEAGEKSGTLEKSLQELSEQFEKRVSNRLKTMTLLIEPILLVFVGLLVGALMLAIIAPIYNLIGQINTR